MSLLHALLGSALIQACEAAGATIPRHVLKRFGEPFSVTDVRPDSVTMTDWLSRVTAGKSCLPSSFGEYAVLRGYAVCVWSR